MTINFNVSDRKPLVKAVSEFLGTKAVYMKTPTCAYRIGNVTVTREGNLRIDDPIDSEQVEKLVAVLAGQGFTAERSDNCPPHAADTAHTGLCVSMPRRLFTDSALANLKALVAAKGGLFKKALGVNEHPRRFGYAADSSLSSARWQGRRSASPSRSMTQTTKSTPSDAFF